MKEVKLVKNPLLLNIVTTFTFSVTKRFTKGFRLVKKQKSLVVQFILIPSKVIKSLNNHVVPEHEEKKPLECNLCEEKFTQ